MPAPVMRGVFSSHVNKVGYDAEKQELFVEWDTGKTSVYSGVPAGLADSVSSGWSVGKALASEIKGKYAHRYEK